MTESVNPDVTGADVPVFPPVPAPPPEAAPPAEAVPLAEAATPEAETGGLPPVPPPPGGETVPGFEPPPGLEPQLDANGQPVYAAQFPPAPDAPAEPKPKSKKKLIALIVALVVLAAAGVGGFYVYSHWSIESLDVALDYGTAGQAKALNVGGTFTGTVETTPATVLKDSYTCTSSAAAILAVEQDGASLSFKSKAPGEATVTCTSENKGAIWLHGFTILQPATAINLEMTELVLTVGGTSELEATVVPEDSTDTLSYKSSDTAIATVDDKGTVTAVAEGSAKITLTAGEISKTLDVTVKPKYTWTTAGASEDIGGTGVTGVPQVADKTVPGCTHVSFMYSMTAVDPESKAGEFANHTFFLYAYSNGSWVKVYTFTYTEVAKIYFGFADFEATDITKLIVIPEPTSSLDGVRWSSSLYILSVS